MDKSVNPLSRRQMLAGLASASFLAGKSHSQILAPIMNGGVPLPLAGLVARYEQANTPGNQGAAVATLFDSSGNGYHATQTANAFKPTVNNHTVSGSRAIYFPGGNGIVSDMILPANLSISTQSVSVVFVLEAAYSAGSNYLLDFGSANSLYFNYNSSKLGAGPSLAPSAIYLPWGPQVVGFASGTAGFKYFLGNAMSPYAGKLAPALPAGGSLNCYGRNQYNAANNIYAVLVYNRAITQADLNQILAYARTKYGVLPVSPHMLLAATGDSMTAGYVAGSYNGLGWLQQWLIGNPTYTAYNFSLTGSKTSALNNPDGVYSFTPTKKICWLWSGTNDLAGGTGQVTPALTNIRTFVAARRAKGWKCVVATILPRNGGIASNPNPGFETDRQAFNAAIRANTGGVYGDAIADVGNDATIGQAGDENKSSWFCNDFTHLTQAGNTLALNSYFAPAIASL